MSWLWQGALPFAAVLGSVVLFHEFGHFLAAKAYGITVEIFSVGFGPRLWGFTWRGTEYRLAWVPLGGYVKLRGETAPEGGAPPDPGDLMAHSRLERFVVFVMGAVFNLATAFGLTTLLFVQGVPEFAYLYEPPVVGEVDQESPARTAGIVAGDRILSIGGKPIANWKELQIEMLLSPGQTRAVELQRGEERITTALEIKATRNDVGRPGIFPATGVLVGGLTPGWPAEKAGLKRGDRLVSIDGAPMRLVTAVFDAIQGSPGKELHFTLEREGQPYDVVIVPRDEGGKGRIGFNPTPPMVTRTYPLVEAARQSVRQNLEYVGLVFMSFRKVLTGVLSLRAFSGPIELYRISGEAAEEGIIPFLQLIAMVSLQLGIINLFPILPLDGGHLFTLTVEGILRRDLSMVLKERMMQAGLILLLLFMGTVIYFDFSKIIFN